MLVFACKGLTSHASRSIEKWMLLRQNAVWRPGLRGPPATARLQPAHGAAPSAGWSVRWQRRPGSTCACAARWPTPPSTPGCCPTHAAPPAGTSCSRPAATAACCCATRGPALPVHARSCPFWHCLARSPCICGKSPIFRSDKPLSGSCAHFPSTESQLMMAAVSDLLIAVYLLAYIRLTEE